MNDLKELEKQFQDLMNERNNCIKKRKSGRLKQHQEQQRQAEVNVQKRANRNANLLQTLERIDYQASALATQTEKLKFLKDQHELKLIRDYENHRATFHSGSPVMFSYLDAYRHNQTSMPSSVQQQQQQLSNQYQMIPQQELHHQQQPQQQHEHYPTNFHLNQLSLPISTIDSNSSYIITPNQDRPIQQQQQHLSTTQQNTTQQQSIHRAPFASSIHQSFADIPPSLPIPQQFRYHTVPPIAPLPIEVAALHQFKDHTNLKSDFLKYLSEKNQFYPYDIYGRHLNPNTPVTSPQSQQQQQQQQQQQFHRQNQLLNPSLLSSWCNSTMNIGYPQYTLSPQQQPPPPPLPLNATYMFGNNFQQNDTIENPPRLNLGSATNGVMSTFTMPPSITAPVAPTTTTTTTATAATAITAALLSNHNNGIPLSTLSNTSPPSYYSQSHRTFDNSDNNDELMQRQQAILASTATSILLANKEIATNSSTNFNDKYLQQNNLYENMNNSAVNVLPPSETQPLQNILHDNNIISHNDDDDKLMTDNLADKKRSQIMNDNGTVSTTAVIPLIIPSDPSKIIQQQPPQSPPTATLFTSTKLSNPINNININNANNDHNHRHDDIQIDDDNILDKSKTTNANHQQVPLNENKIETTVGIPASTTITKPSITDVLSTGNDTAIGSKKIIVDSLNQIDNSAMRNLDKNDNNDKSEQLLNEATLINETNSNNNNNLSKDADVKSNIDDIEATFYGEKLSHPIPPAIVGGDNIGGDEVNADTGKPFLLDNGQTNLNNDEGNVEQENNLTYSDNNLESYSQQENKNEENHNYQQSDQMGYNESVQPTPIDQTYYQDYNNTEPNEDLGYQYEYQDQQPQQTPDDQQYESTPQQSEDQHYVDNSYIEGDDQSAQQYLTTADDGGGNANIDNVDTSIIQSTNDPYYSSGQEPGEYYQEQTQLYDPQSELVEGQQYTASQEPGNDNYYAEDTMGYYNSNEGQQSQIDQQEPQYQQKQPQQLEEDSSTLYSDSVPLNSTGGGEGYGLPAGSGFVEPGNYIESETDTSVTGAGVEMPVNTNPNDESDFDFSTNQ